MAGSQTVVGGISNPVGQVAVAVSSAVERLGGRALGGGMVSARTPGRFVNHLRRSLRLHLTGPLSRMWVDGTRISRNTSPGNSPRMNTPVSWKRLRPLVIAGMMPPIAIRSVAGIRELSSPRRAAANAAEAMPERRSGPDFRARAARIRDRRDGFHRRGPRRACRPGQGRGSGA